MTKPLGRTAFSSFEPKHTLGSLGDDAYDYAQGAAVKLWFQV